MKTLILAGAALGLSMTAAFAGDGGDFPMPPPAAAQVAPSTMSTVKAGTPVLHAFVANHSTTTSVFPQNSVGGGAHD
jgi:hypothetical protein